MAKFTQLLIGGAEITAGVLLAVASGGTLTPIAALLISAGVGTTISGIGTLLSKGPVNGFATTTRNPTASWQIIYGRQRTGGTVVYLNMWPGPVPNGNGNNSDQMLDMVVVIASHSCQSVDAVLFDQQRVQIDTTAAPGGAATGSGTSFTPVQQTVKYTGSNPTRIQRVNNVVTVTLSNNIPYLTAGDHVKLTNVPGDLTLNGTFQVEQIISQVFGAPGSIVFTFLSGGANSDVVNAGWVTTLWADYGRTVYFEPMLGGQALGQTFAGMISGTPLSGDMGDLVSPDNTGGLNANNQPNPWTANCSLQGKTAVFIRMRYSAQYYKGGLPQISFLVHGKNDILDPRNSPPTNGYSENAALCIADFISNTTWGFSAAYGTEIPYANLISAANACDEPVALAYSLSSPPLTEPAYALNGKFDLATKRGEILQNMLTACAGRLTYISGQYIIWPAAWIGNTFSIGSNPGGGVIALGNLDIIAAGPVKWKPTVQIRDEYNGVKGTYVSQGNKWLATDFPPYCQDTMHGYTSSPPVPEGDINMAADGGDRRWKDIQLPFTISASTAQRIAKIELLRSRNWGTGTLVLNMVGYQITPLDLITITWPYLNWTEKQFEVIATRLRIEDGKSEEGNTVPAPILIVEVDIQETDPSIYDWSTTEELSPQGYIQPVIPGVGTFKFFATETVPGYDVPFPWSPGYIAPLLGDALYPGPSVGSPPTSGAKASFGVSLQYGLTSDGNATANLQIKGTIPPNDLSDINAPQIECTAGTSGSLPPGSYVIAADAIDTSTPQRNSPLSTPVTVTIPVSSPPVNNGSIAVSVSWPDGANGGDIYMGQNNPDAGYDWQIQLSPGSSGTTLTEFNQSTSGAPDGTLDHLAVALKQIIHAGCWAQQIPDLTSNTITIAGSGMTTNQWQDYVLTLYGRYDSTQEVLVLNMPISASSASSGGQFVLTIGTNSAGQHLPDLTTLLVVGDLVVMRMKLTFTATSFQDLNVANTYYPNGATNVEAGHLAMVITGVDAGDVQTIASVSTDINGNYTIFEIAGNWEITPNTGDIVIIVEAAFGPEYHTNELTAPTRAAVTGLVAAPPVGNIAGQQLLCIVRTQNSTDDNGLDQYAPMREFYMYGSQGTRTIFMSQTMLLTDRIIDADATGGSITYTLLPFSEVPNLTMFVQKVDNTANVVVVQCASGDTLSGASSVTLVKQWDSVWFAVSGNG